MKHFLFLFCLVILFGCNEKKKTKSIKTIVLYSENDKIPNAGENVKIIIKDTMCLFEKNRAMSDIKNGKLKIYFSFLNFRKDFDIDNYNELEKYLSKYNIAIDTIVDEYSSGCCHSSKFERYCYQNTMKTEIEKKHGKNFLDSLCNLVEKSFVKKNPNRIYEFTECDMVSRYPNTKNYNDMFHKSKRDFFEQFKYPIDYKFKNEKYYSYTTASFLLSKTGKISDLKTEAHLQNFTNRKHKSYFETEVAKFIKTVKFVPATSCGIAVNSKMELSFTNK